MHTAPDEFAGLNPAALAAAADPAATGSEQETQANYLKFNPKALSVLYYSICAYLNFPKGHITSKLEQHRQSAAKSVMKYVAEKGLKTLYSEAELAGMTAESREEAVALYLEKNSGQVRRIRESIFYETLLMDAQALAMKAYLQKKGATNKTTLVLEKSRLAAEVTEELKKNYVGLHKDGLTDQEFLSRYNRDYNKILKFRFTSFMAQELGIIQQPALSL